MKESYSYFLKIKPIDLAWFTCTDKDNPGPLAIARCEAKLRKEAKNKLNLTNKQEKTFDGILDKAGDLNKTPEEYQKHLEEVLSEKHLKPNMKRHQTTYFLAMLLRSQSHEQETVEEMISTVIANTFDSEDHRHLINEDTTLEFALSEVTRLVKYVFDNNKEIHFIQKKITISRAEVLKILSLKKPWARQMTFAVLIHQKKYANKETGNFYMAYSELAWYGCDATPARSKAQILELSETTGFVEPVSMGIKKTKWADNKCFYETNVYKVQLLTEAEQKSDDNQLTMELNTTKRPSFEEVMVQLVSQDEAKALLTKSQYYNTFKELYEVIH